MPGNVMELTKISTELIKSQDGERMVYLYKRPCQLGHESCVRAVEIEIELHLPVVCTWITRTRSTQDLSTWHFLQRAHHRRHWVIIYDCDWLETVYK